MCGIAGTFQIAGGADHESLIREIVRSQHRRGPDFQAVEKTACRDWCSVLGHNRLSIIDLSEAANQPMWDSDREFCIVHNGEVFNYLELREELEALGHRFHTQSDTEVILEAFKQWGTAAFERFNGMFAFALLCKADGRLWLVRDRFGVKPLFYHFDGQTLIFASSGRVIANHFGLAPNLDYVARGLRYLFYEDDSSITGYCGLHAVAPSHCLEVSVDKGRLRHSCCRYYNLCERVLAIREKLATQPVPQLVELVSGALEYAVRLRLRADVPVGLSLSGGLDSSAIAALAAEKHGAMIGFTFGHPQDPATEGPLAAELGRKAGIEVEFISPNVDEIIQAFWDTLEAQDAPFGSLSVVAQYLVYKAARARGVKVLLGGQGGDEAFMGYRKFQLFHLRELLCSHQWKAACAFSFSLLPQIAVELPSASELWKQYTRYIRKAGMKHGLNLPHPAPCSIGYDGRQPLWMRQLRDYTAVSLPVLLRFEDRNSMGNSIESRLPFLGYRLAEIGIALPTAVKLRAGFRKWILRRLIRGKIPGSIRTARYKRGFDVKQTVWIRSGLGECMRTQLRKRASVIQELLPPGADIGHYFSDAALCRNPSLNFHGTEITYHFQGVGPTDQAKRRNSNLLPNQGIAVG